MGTHLDPRVHAVGPAHSTAFPPPGYESQAQPVAPHHSPEHYSEELAAQSNVSVAEPQYDGDAEYTDYFGFSQTHRYFMPDRKQYIEFKTLAEGDLAEYQRLLNRDVTVEKTTGNARIKINQVEERHALLQVAVTGWHMMRRDNKDRWIEVPFSTRSPGSTFMQWIKGANPEIVADLDEQIRKLNPTLLAANNETLEAIDKQIADLYEQRKTVEARMQGNSFSATS